MELIPQTLEHDLVLAIGTFDGVHLGHRHLVQHTLRRARERGCLSAAITFHPHPRAVVTGHGPACLSTLDERLALLRGLGLDVVLALPFTQDLARLPALDFMSLLCQSMRLRELWVGSDFALGYRREGTVTRLTEIGRDLGYQVHGVPPLVLHGRTVSSTLVRELVAQGRVEAAARLLARRHHVTGTAMPGERRDCHPAWTTASVATSDGLAMPAGGVYRAWVHSGDRQWPATVHVEPDGGVTARRLSVSLPGGSAGDLYGRLLRVEFVRRLRPGERAQLVRTPLKRDLTVPSSSPAFHSP